MFSFQATCEEFILVTESCNIQFNQFNLFCVRYISILHNARKVAETVLPTTSEQQEDVPTRQRRTSPWRPASLLKPVLRMSTEALADGSQVRGEQHKVLIR